MASYKEYKCEGCGYTVNANPKGKDIVMMGEVYNYLCPDCKDRQVSEMWCGYESHRSLFVCRLNIVFNRLA